MPDDELIDKRSYCQDYTESNLHLYEVFKEELLRKFVANKRVVSVQRKVPGRGGFTVGVHVHIRRGDVNGVHWQYTPIDTFHDMLSGIKKGLGVHNISMDVHIHSEGSKDEFRRLTDAFNAVLHLDEDVLQTWYAQMSAHVLVLSKSSLSHTAGLYNQDIVVYSPAYHKPLPTWFVFDNDPDKLAERFAEHKIRDILHNAVQKVRLIRFPHKPNRSVNVDWADRLKDTASMTARA